AGPDDDRLKMSAAARIRMSPSQVRYRPRFRLGGFSVATIAVGDVHGHASALEDLLETVLPDLGPDDRLVFLGDMIVRGPDSKQVLDRVARLRRESRHEVICLMGNHEQWLLESLRDPTQHHWALSCSAFSTIASYAPDAAAALRRVFGEV